MLPSPPATPPDDVSARRTGGAPTPAGQAADAGDARQRSSGSTKGAPAAPAPPADDTGAIGARTVLAPAAVAVTDVDARVFDDDEDAPDDDDPRHGREDYVVALTAADDLDDLQHYEKIDVVDLLQGVYDVVSPWAADGIVFPELRDKLANEPARVLSGWAQYAPSHQWSPPWWWEHMFRLSIVASFLLGSDSFIAGSPAVRALRDAADACARRLCSTYTMYGVIEGAACDRYEVYEAYMNVPPEEEAYLYGLPFSDGDMRTCAKAISLALIEKITATPLFEGVVMAAIERELPGPDRKWPPLEAPQEPEPQADPYIDCKELRPSIPTRRVIVEEPRGLVGAARG